MEIKKISREDWAGWGWTTRIRMGRLRFHPQVCRGEVFEWFVTHKLVIAPGHVVGNDQDARPAGSTDRDSYKGVFEPDAFVSQPIHVGRVYERVHAAHRVETLVVNEQEDDVRPVGSLGLCGTDQCLGNECPQDKSAG